MDNITLPAWGFGTWTVFVAIVFFVYGRLRGKLTRKQWDEMVKGKP